MEGVEELEKKLERILESSNFKEVYLSPNTGLEFPLETKAFEKMKLLSRLKKAVDEVMW